MKHKMKMKQNQRITRITEKTLVVGVDIAKRLHVARAVDFRGTGRQEMRYKSFSAADT